MGVLPRTGRAAAAALLAGALAAAGCAAGYVGTRRDDGVARAFRNAEVLPGFRYHVYPPTELPEAILGVRGDLVLAEGLWTEVAMTPERLRRYVEGMGTADRGVAAALPPAQAIVAPDGAVVGLWLSPKPLPRTRPPAAGRISVPLPLGPEPGGSLPPGRPFLGR